MKILVVDDDAMMLTSISHSLREEGYDVAAANDAYKAIGILQEEKVDLIVSDIMMPNISGVGLLGLLKQFQFDKIPVVVISSLNKGDMVLVDRSLTVSNGKIVIVLVGNEMFIRRLEMGNGKIFLVPGNSTLASMDVTQIPFEIWGVVTYVVHSL